MNTFNCKRPHIVPLDGRSEISVLDVKWYLCFLVVLAVCQLLPCPAQAEPLEERKAVNVISNNALVSIESIRIKDETAIIIALDEIVEITPKGDNDVFSSNFRVLPLGEADPKQVIETCNRNKYEEWVNRMGFYDVYEFHALLFGSIVGIFILFLPNIVDRRR